ncbi:MAG: YicC family protein [Rhodospirillaceae bacterium]|nr:YicC family protein [Rhodospirillaceae bacterium]|tara:strand:+ start:4192 stop:5106 length:915 start_codon:yes stop_codon:yes gene_type:complete
MAVESMTGFGRIEGSFTVARLEQTLSWCWELKSYNGKGLEIRCKLPTGKDKLEKIVIEEIRKELRRGTITANLSQKVDIRKQILEIDEQLLSELSQLNKKFIKGGLVSSDPLRMDSLLTAPGILKIVTEKELNSSESKAIDTAIARDFKKALRMLSSMRRNEGEKISRILKEKIRELGREHKKITKCLSSRSTSISRKLKSQVKDLLDSKAAIDPVRLNQELALLLVKVDISEEVERISAHLTACQELLLMKKPVGRRLDFISQELIRETNTICSKSNNQRLTSIAIDIKVAVESFREQIQNVQ